MGKMPAFLFYVTYYSLLRRKALALTPYVVVVSLQAKPEQKNTDSVQKRNFSLCHFPLVAIY